MTLIVILLIAFAFLFLAHVTRSSFISVMAGLVGITGGVALIAYDSDYWAFLIFGSAFIAVGLYHLVMVGVDLAKGQ